MLGASLVERDRVRDRETHRDKERVRDRFSDIHRDRERQRH